MMVTDKEEMKSIADLPDGWFVHQFIHKVDIPYVIASPEHDYCKDEKFTIPQPLVDFFVKHWAGSDGLRETIKRDLQVEIRNVLGIK